MFISCVADAVLSFLGRVLASGRAMLYEPGLGSREYCAAGRKPPACSASSVHVEVVDGTLKQLSAEERRVMVSLQPLAITVSAAL
jgi:hypothetical protein